MSNVKVYKLSNCYELICYQKDTYCELTVADYSLPWEPVIENYKTTSKDEANKMFKYLANKYKGVTY